MKIRIPRRLTIDDPAYRPTSTSSIRDVQSEQQRVLRRLQGLIETHQESAERMNLALDAEDILTVIDALEAEAEKREPLSSLKCPDEVREYVRLALYDEMLGEPSNVFIATPVGAETIRYEAMPRAFWLDCLRALRREWEAKPRATSMEDSTTPQGRHERPRNP